jgi:ketosteroid isomerase-like protein
MKAILGVVALIMFSLSAQQGTATEPEAAIRQADAAWMRAIAAKSIQDTMASYDPDAVTAGSAMFRAQGLQAFRESWTKMFAVAGFALSWETKRIVIIESGTIAYSSGTWKDGNEGGPFLVVWRKQPDGKWKVLIDAAWMASQTGK